MTERAVLAVSFGTSHRDTLEKNIAAIEAELAAAFPERTVRRAFTSGMILRKLAGEGTHIDNVPQALERLASDLARQGEFVLEGEEYKRPKGQVSPLLQPWFQKKSITLCCAREPDGLFTSPELADFLADAFERLMPYYDYFRALELEPVPEN